MGKFEELLVLREGENRKACHKRIKEEWMMMLRNAKHTPTIHGESITPTIVMEGYIARIVNQKTLKPLTPAGYGGNRTGVFHLIHCHNGTGQCPRITLWKGFSRTTNKRKMRARRQQPWHDDASGNGDANADANSVSRVGPRGRDSCSVPGVTFLN
jgi:hypothetical protein